jgi:site-specific recombinase XerD
MHRSAQRRKTIRMPFLAVFFACRTLRQFGVDLKVQQELLRHADIRTTMNVYTQAVSEQKRAAHSKVVQMVLSA